MNTTKKQNAPGELIYGIHPIVEALKAKRRKFISIYTTKPTPRQWQTIEPLLPKHGIAIQYVERSVLDKMVGSEDHQGVVAWVQVYPYRKKFFEPERQSFLVMVDGIQDTRNLGGIIRSAHCAGADGVIICKKNGTLLSNSAIKSSAGLAEHMEVYVANSAQEAVQLLKAAGYNLYMAAFGGENALQHTYKLPLCLIIGNEASGITKAILSAGQQVTLPQRSSDISYNASVAAGILLCHIGAQQQKI